MTGSMGELPTELFVIIRSTGEYSERMESPIRYVLTEAEAQLAVAQADAEKGLPTPLPHPPYESTHEWTLPDGTVRDVWGAVDGVTPRLLPKPNAAEIEGRTNRLLEEYYKAIVDAGRVDPFGPAEQYSYELVTHFRPLERQLKGE